jgi:hypothetical protein
MDEKDLVGEKTVLKQHSIPARAEKSMGEGGDNVEVSVRNSDDQTLETLFDDRECKQNGDDLKGEIILRQEDHQLLTNGTLPNCNSEEKALTIDHPIVKESDASLSDPSHSLSKIDGPAALLREGAVDEDTVLSFEFMRAALQAPSLPECALPSCSTKSETFVPVPSVLSHNTHLVDGIQYQKSSAATSDASIEVPNDSPTMLNSEVKSTLALPEEHASSTATNPFSWASSKKIVFVNGVLFDTTIPVPKYKPKRSKKSKRRRRRRRALAAAEAEATADRTHEKVVTIETDGELEVTVDSLPIGQSSTSSVENDESGKQSNCTIGGKPESVVDQAEGLTLTSLDKVSSRAKSRSEGGRNTKMSPRPSWQIDEVLEAALPSMNADEALDETAVKASIFTAATDNRGYDDGEEKQAVENALDANDETARSAVNSRKRSHSNVGRGTTAHHDKMLQHQQEMALRFLKAASDYGSMQAALDLIHEYHSDIVLNKEAKASVDQAIVAIPYLMHSAMMKFLTFRRKDGGPGFSGEKANRIAMDLFERMGPACCGDKVSEADLMDVGGLHKVEALRVLPHLLRVAGTVSDQRKHMRKQLVASSAKQQTSVKKEQKPAQEQPERRFSSRKRQRMNG